MAGSSIDSDQFRRILSRNVAMPLGMGVLSALVFVGIIAYLINVLSWVEHSQHVIGRANEVSRLSSDMEAGMRGYVLSGDDDFMEPYLTAKPCMDAELKKFIAENPVKGVNLRLASGNVGVMAATNEAVSAAEERMLLAIFGALALLCLLTFRSVAATLCVLVPLTIVSIFCNALMAVMGIGLKVATLPVVALGVGVGVDYGIYLFERIQHDLEEGSDFRSAFYEAMRQRGTAAVFTAITMAIGVGTWAFSALKFQADMGILLAFMFLWNMLGALVLLPALACFLLPRARPASAAADATAAKVLV